jgi:hypothetical protein
MSVWSAIITSGGDGDGDTTASWIAGDTTTEIAIKADKIARIITIPELSDDAGPASTGDLVDMGDNLDGVRTLSMATH